MLNIYRYKTEECAGFLSKLENRASSPSEEIIKTVTDIIEDVKKNGDAALLSYTEKFDKVKLTPETLEMSRSELEKQAEKVPEELKKTIRRACENIKKYHKKQLRQSFFDTSDTQKLVGMRITPKSRAGIYVPGGSAAYPSSVLMNCVPAKVAGVSEIIMTTPLRDGEIPPAHMQEAMDYLSEFVSCGQRDARPGPKLMDWVRREWSAPALTIHAAWVTISAATSWDAMPINLL